MNKRENIKNNISFLKFIGPAFIASVAYIDPGNYATDTNAGSAFGYELIWVVVMANIMAMFIQNMSAKIGIATGKCMSELCNEYLNKKLVIFMWVFSEIATMATDLAEILGAVIGINLLFGIPMIDGVCIVGITTYVILMLEKLGISIIEKIIITLISIITICYLIELYITKKVIHLHELLPKISHLFHQPNEMFLAVGIVGATIMPHVIYLHSELTESKKFDKIYKNITKKTLYKYSFIEVMIAMTIAGIINIAILVVQANIGGPQVSTLTQAYQSLSTQVGYIAAVIFAISLVVSGISSSVVGTMAGQVVMQEFVNFKIPLWIRRIVTMIPAIIVILIGVNATSALITSQVALSIVLPIPVVTLIFFTRKKTIMGELVNKKITTFLLIVVTCVILLLNTLLVIKTV